MCLTYIKCQATDVFVCLFIHLSIHFNFIFKTNKQTSHKWTLTWILLYYIQLKTSDYATLCDNTYKTVTHSSTFVVDILSCFQEIKCKEVLQCMVVQGLAKSNTRIGTVFIIYIWICKLGYVTRILIIILWLFCKRCKTIYLID